MLSAVPVSNAAGGEKTLKTMSFRAVCICWQYFHLDVEQNNITETI